MNGELFTVRGEDRQASEVLDQCLWDATSPFFVIARLERARIAEQLGDRDPAIRWYQFVLDTWRHTDSELQGAGTGRLESDGIAQGPLRADSRELAAIKSGAGRQGEPPRD